MPNFSFPFLYFFFISCNVLPILIFSFVDTLLFKKVIPFIYSSPLSVWEYVYKIGPDLAAGREEAAVYLTPMQTLGMILAVAAGTQLTRWLPFLLFPENKAHMQVMHLALATEKDVLLFFSYSGSTKDMEDIMHIAKERRISVILVTHFPNSCAAGYADVVLLCGYNESPLQSGSVAAKLGQLFIIECLFYVFCKRNPDILSKARASTIEAIMPKFL